MSIKMKKSLFFPILFIFGLFLLNSCIKFNPSCPPPTKLDLSVSVETWNGDPNVVGSTPLPDVAFDLTINNCSNGRQITTVSPLNTGQTGKSNTAITLEEAAICSDGLSACQPTIQITKMTSPAKFVIWNAPLFTSSKTNQRAIIVFKPKTVIQLQVKRDSADVNQLSIATIQSNATGATNQVNRVSANKQPVNTTLFFDIAKGVDTRIQYVFDTRVVRIDTIKSTQLDTLMYVVKL